jgi:hypothetical protein
VGVKRWRKKAEDRFAAAPILKEAPGKLQGPYANDDDDDEEEEEFC